MCERFDDDVWQECMVHDLSVDTAAAVSLRRPLSRIVLVRWVESTPASLQAQRVLNLNPRREVSGGEARGTEVRRETSNPEPQIFEATSASARGDPPLIRDH